jgi:hypothetical protein
LGGDRRDEAERKWERTIERTKRPDEGWNNCEGKRHDKAKFCEVFAKLLTGGVGITFLIFFVASRQKEPGAKRTTKVV